MPNNWAEGLVIKPAKPIFLPDGKRVLFKKKNELFKEGGEVVTDSCVTDEFAKFNTRLATCFTVNRFNNVVSHYGTNERMEFYFDMFIQDAIDEVDREVYNNFTDSQKKLLRKLSAKYIWPIIKLELKR